MEVQSKDLLEEFVPHPEDVALDNEPTMFDLMHNQLEEMNNDFDSSDDEDEDEVDGADEEKTEKEGRRRLRKGGGRGLRTRG